MENLSARIVELEESAKEMRYHKRENEKDLNQRKMNLTQCMQRLREMENVNNKRLHSLKSSGAEKIFEAYQWVQEHRSMFNMEIYGPVLLEVNIANRFHADYLEGHVAHYIWKAFITQDPKDLVLLQEKMKPFGVPVINHVNNDGGNREPFRMTEEMRKLGISSRLDQVFEASHAAVKEVLIGDFGLDHSYIGSKETDAKADLVLRLGIMDVWTPENHYHWSRSHYGSHVSGNVESVGRSRLLLCNLDVKEIDSARSKKVELEEQISVIDADLKSLQIALRQKEDEAAELQREREEIVNVMQSKKKKLRELEQTVNQRRIKLKSIERADDREAAIAKLTDKVKELKSQRFHSAIEVKNLLIEAVAYRRSFAENNMSSIEIEAKIKEMESNAKQQEMIAMQASQNLENRKSVTENFRHQLSVAMKHAQSVAVITPELSQAFQKMPATIEELEATIQDTISQANSILFLNNNILEEYESRQRKIEELTRKQEMDGKELKDLLDEINALKGCWLPALRNLVTRINETFSRNFQEMAVAGEVSLDERDTDFDQYGILIKVKFRSAQFRPFSTLFLYKTLQTAHLGYGPINERKMFQQLVRAASQPNTPQCFLLTPKLLPNLEYSDACSILTVMNGPWIEQPSKVWSGGDSWGSLRLPIGEK
ncbi:structural maintenance of chromosomes 5 [Striga asiatica]|uniref:Structural maintenance of chromosomes protein 5 n=1 Tax=Striga asiatica TaxID=4170 RepID=A0A5A7QM85_STRAF|nr:structural maintenance of chromosomes 5 [Striga asiatica]